MASNTKYGELPAMPEYVATVEGVDGFFRVWGIDWLEKRVLLHRAYLVWTPISKVAFEDVAAISLAPHQQAEADRIAGQYESLQGRGSDAAGTERPSNDDVAGVRSEMGDLLSQYFRLTGKPLR